MSISNFQLLISNFQLSWDLLMIIIFIGAVFLYGITLGRNKLIALLVSSYFSLIITGSIPWKMVSVFFGLKDLSSPSPTFKIFLFLALILFFFFLIPQSALGSVLRVSKGRQGSWFQILVFAILEIGLLTSIILSFLPSKVISDLNPLVRDIFLGQLPQFFWMTIPILALVLIRRKKIEEG